MANPHAQNLITPEAFFLGLVLKKLSVRKKIIGPKKNETGIPNLAESLFY